MNKEGFVLVSLKTARKREQTKKKASTEKQFNVASVCSGVSERHRMWKHIILNIKIYCIVVRAYSLGAK